MRRRSSKRILAALILALAVLAGACQAASGPAAAPTATPASTPTKAPPTEAAPTEAPTAVPTQAPTDTPVPQAAGGLLYVLSNSSPHVTVIDGSSHEIVRTADLPDFTAWTWNDDNNHFDGRNLWLGMKHPDTNQAEVITLDLETLEVTYRFPVGVEKLTLYIGKATAEGLLHVGKMDSDEVVVFDTRSFELIDTWQVPVNGDVVCDADISTDAHGVERFVYPTRKGDTVVSIDPRTGETLTIVDSPAGANPLMLTAGPDGNVWVQESGSNTNAVYDPESLELLARFPTGKAPIVNTFSPDGRLSYIGHGDDTFVQVVDVQSLEEVQRVQAGTNPQKLAVHPDGSRVYAILTKEAAVAVIDTGSWTVSERVPLGTNPTGIYFRGGS